MRKNLGVKPYFYPMPVLVIGTYNEDGTANAMTAAWGGIANSDLVAICVDRGHKTVENLKARGAFTIGIATESTLAEADYLGIDSGHRVPDKVARTGLTIVKSEFVDAPLFEEFAMSMECEMVKYDDEMELLYGRIKNLGVDESVLDEKGNIDRFKLKPITFDTVYNTYTALGEHVGTAYKDGLKFRG